MTTPKARAPLPPIPKFGNYGLLPVGIHDCSMGLLKATFATNTRRLQLYESLCIFIQILKQKNLDGRLLVDGSYVTDKEIPGDIEVILDVTNQAEDIQSHGIVFFYTQRNNLKNKGIDFYIEIEGGNSFAAFFQYAGEKTGAEKKCSSKQPKGILCITDWKTERLL